MSARPPGHANKEIGLTDFAHRGDLRQDTVIKIGALAVTVRASDLDELTHVDENEGV